MKKTLILLLSIFLTNISFITAQETSETAPAAGTVESPDSAVEDPELEAFRKEQQQYFETGFELYIHYPMSMHFPGWSYSDVDYDFFLFDLTLPGPNISWGGLGAGFEIDFGSRKRVLKNMGIGSLLEISALSSFNMIDGVDLGLLLSYPYLFYTTRRETGLNFSIRAGIGLGMAIDSEDLFAYPEEKNHPFGALYSLEAAAIFPMGSFRFQAGGAYRFLAINSKNIHMYTPLLRAGYRF